MFTTLPRLRAAVAELQSAGATFRSHQALARALSELAELGLTTAKSHLADLDIDGLLTVGEPRLGRSPQERGMGQGVARRPLDLPGGLSPDHSDHFNQSGPSDHSDPLAWTHGEILTLYQHRRASHANRHRTTCVLGGEIVEPGDGRFPVPWEPDGRAWPVVCLSRWHEIEVLADLEADLEQIINRQEQQ